jgi:hypothetical protein
LSHSSTSNRDAFKHLSKSISTFMKNATKR